MEHKYKAPVWARSLFDISGSLSEDFLGGPRKWKMAWVINFHKVVTLFITLGLMVHYEHYTTAAYVYLALHGIYGYCWLVKDFGFRDGSFETRVTYPGAFMLYVMLVGWYWLLPYLFMSQRMEPSNTIVFWAVAINLQGITWMIAADCQKHFSLKYRRGLITDGVFAYTRNPNFLGEIMIYGSFAMMVNHWIGWLVMVYMITFFYARMHVKDESISRYPEWDEYARKSHRLIPWGLVAALFKSGERNV
jgi:protein-S-isoprenylcysteine O-methyltransferase Ste14